MMLFSAELVLPITDTPRKNFAVAVDSGKIIEFGPRPDLKKKYPQAEEIHHPLLLPGLINAHTHLELSGIPLQSGAKDFVDWLIRIIEKKRMLDPAQIELDAKNEMGRCLKLGVTSLGDIASHPAILGTHRHNSLASTVFFELIEMRDEDVPNRIALAKSALGEFNYRLENNRLGISLHTPYTASIPLFEAARDVALERGLCLCTHLAESREEVEFISDGAGPILERLYPFVGWRDFKPVPSLRSPAQYLERQIDENITLIHCVQVSDEDMGIISRARAIVHCPRSNLNLTGNLAPVPKMIQAGAIVALGTDSPASAGDSNLWNEMRKVYELRSQYPGGEILASQILKMATINAARAIFRESDLGSIEPGKIANLLALDLPGLPDDPEKISHAIIESGAKNISGVYAAGKAVS